MTNREVLLQKIIEFNHPIDKIISELHKIGWDSNEDLIILKRRDIISVLEKYMQSKITKTEIEEWANLLECREDIGFEIGYENIIGETIFVLANPDISYHINIEKVQELIRNLI